jgi:hypothetical protein
LQGHIPLALLLDERAVARLRSAVLIELWLGSVGSAIGAERAAKSRVISRST